MEYFEVCAFCGELFKGEKIKDCKPHYITCRDSYEEPEYDNCIEADYQYRD